MDLFAPPDFDYGELRKRLVDAAAQGVYLGTSSWKYPGWLGTVYDPQRYIGRGGKMSGALLERTCLAEYAMLFPTVCVDAAYYRFPVVDDLLAMAAQVPAGFRFTFKVTDEITIKHFPRLPKFGKKGGTGNPEFLNVDLFNRMFLRPCESIASKVGMHDLDGNFSIKSSIKGFVDTRHSTVGHLADELISPINKFAGQVRHIPNSM